MAKYKVGDKVLVRVAIHRVVEESAQLPYEVKEVNNKQISPATIWVGKKDVVDDMAPKELWGIARKIVRSYHDGKISDDDLFEIFGIDKNSESII